MKVFCDIELHEKFKEYVKKYESPKRVVADPAKVREAIEFTLALTNRLREIEKGKFLFFYLKYDQEPKYVLFFIAAKENYNKEWRDREILNPTIIIFSFSFFCYNYICYYFIFDFSSYNKQRFSYGFALSPTDIRVGRVSFPDPQ